jgi:hypothetical protein
VPRGTESVAAFLAGFTAAEGSFFVSGRRFTFSVGLGASDIAMCTLFRDFLGRGSVSRSPRRQPHYDDECAFMIQSLQDHVEVTIPFMDEHLPVSYKREQYLVWRAALLEYWEHRAKRVRPCTVDDCDEPRRAKGRCRHHYYEAYGR